MSVYRLSSDNGMLARNKKHSCLCLKMKTCNLCRKTIYEYPDANEFKHPYKATDIPKSGGSVNISQLERSRNGDKYYRVLSVASISVPRCEKPGVLHMRKQRNRSASR